VNALADERNGTGIDSLDLDDIEMLERAVDAARRAFLPHAYQVPGCSGGPGVNGSWRTTL
jgi:hypothetical protein